MTERALYPAADKLSRDVAEKLRGVEWALAHATGEVVIVCLPIGDGRWRVKVKPSL